MTKRAALDKGDKAKAERIQPVGSLSLGSMARYLLTSTGYLYNMCFNNNKTNLTVIIINRKENIYIMYF